VKRWSSVIYWSTELQITPTQYDVRVSKALGLQNSNGQTLSRMNVTFKCRSNVVLDKYDEYLMMFTRTQAHYAAAMQISECATNQTSQP